MSTAQNGSRNSLATLESELLTAATALQNLLTARAKFSSFCQYVAPDEPPAEHHRLLCDALDGILSGDVRRLMVFMPPGSAKSTYASVRFPAYYLARKPGHSLIATSYSDTLATSFGRKVRNLVDTPEYSRVFPDVRLSEGLRAAGEWETNHAGAYFAAGVGSGITGRRGDGGLIDDPVKGRQEADSQAVRDASWDWYKSDFLTRLKPGAWQIIIQTRWHEDDLSGRLLPKEWAGESGDIKCSDGQTWRVICLPAQAVQGDPLGREPGAWLWPEWFTPQYWTETRAAQDDTRNWSSLYQQTPRPETGTFFRREWFKRFRSGEEPQRLNTYAASDFAVTKAAGDFTEHIVAGFDAKENLYFLDGWSGQEQADVWIDEQIKLAKTHKPLVWVAEGGPIRRSIEPFLIKRKAQKKSYFRTEWITSNRDKTANARSFQALASMGKVSIVKNQWGDDLIDQLVAFPTGKYDDKVDACGLLGRLLDQTYGPRRKRSAMARLKDAWGRPVEVENWKTA